jgi:hypothetical protein
MIRRHGSRPTIALWMLVAIADVAILAATAGALGLALLAVGAVLLSAAVAGAWMWQRRPEPQRQAVLRRRA